MTENLKRVDDFEMDVIKWELMKQSKNPSADEEKRLYRAKATKEDFAKYSNSSFQHENLNELLEKYPHMFCVAWKWGGHYPNKKMLFCSKGAERLYNELTINGWQSAA